MYVCMYVCMCVCVYVCMCVCVYVCMCDVFNKFLKSYQIQPKCFKSSQFWRYKRIPAHCGNPDLSTPCFVACNNHGPGGIERGTSPATQMVLPFVIWTGPQKCGLGSRCCFDSGGKNYWSGHFLSDVWQNQVDRPGWVQGKNISTRSQLVPHGSDLVFTPHGTM